MTASSRVIESIVTLCTILGLLCLCQILTCGILSVAVSEVLTFTGSEYATGVTLVAGLIALPVTTRIRMSKVLPYMERIFGYTLCYLQLIVIISLATNLTGSVLAVRSVFGTRLLEENVYDLVKDYGYKRSSKVLVDNLQFALQCCGSYGYEDWFGIDDGWNRNVDVGFEDLSDLLTDEEFEVKKNYKGNPVSKSVPYSCCARWANSGCLHTNLHDIATNTINKEGCAKKLRESMNLVLWFEFGVNLVCAALEVAILVLLKTARNLDSDVNPVISFSKIRSKTTDMFANEEPQKQVAEIEPSYHSEINIDWSKTTSG